MLVNSEENITLQNFNSALKLSICKKISSIGNLSKLYVILFDKCYDILDERNIVQVKMKRESARFENDSRQGGEFTSFARGVKYAVTRVSSNRCNEG